MISIHLFNSHVSLRSNEIVREQDNGAVRLVRQRWQMQIPSCDVFSRNCEQLPSRRGYGALWADNSPVYMQNIGCGGARPDAAAQNVCFVPSVVARCPERPAAPTGLLGDCSRVHRGTAPQNEHCVAIRASQRDLLSVVSASARIPPVWFRPRSDNCKRKRAFHPAAAPCCRTRPHCCPD